jgi:uncharacterized protein (UPF0210 family)
MKIRSITCFANPHWPLSENVNRLTGDFIPSARSAFEAAGYEVQTTRLATIPFPNLLPSLNEASVVEFALTMESWVKSHGYDYVSIGPALPEYLDSYRIIPAVLAATRDVFLAGMMTTPDGGISLPAVRYCADAIHRSAEITPDGFANLRFAALANVSPGTPFFPAAYHLGEKPAFALAIEAADLAVAAFTNSSNLERARQTLIDTVENHARLLTTVADELANRFSLSFDGIDFTPAPFPEDAISLGTAMERMGVSAVGLHGSLAAAAILTDTMDRASYLRAGFNGLMLPVLEDARLAMRAEEGKLTMKDLLLYSAVCGTGLDTVPLPGDTTVEQLYAVLLDLATLAQRLDKPLTARLMPIPGKKAGDATGFDFSFFANSRIMALDSEPLSGLLNGQETVSINKRNRR